MNSVLSPEIDPGNAAHTYGCEGVLVCTPADNQSHPPYQGWLITDDGEHPVTCWVDLPLFSNSWLVDKVRAVLMRLPDGTLVVVRVDLDESIDPLAVKPAHLCPIPSTVDAVRDLVERITTPELRQLVQDVLSLRKVFDAFWTSTAGSRHHTYPGGLARHSVEVASRVNHVMASPQLRQVNFTVIECEIALVTALLHDVGKTISYGPRGFCNERALVMGHDLLGLELIRPPMDALRDVRPDLADALSTLLLSRTRFTCGPYRLEAIREVISHADRASVAKDQARR